MAGARCKRSGIDSGDGVVERVGEESGQEVSGWEPAALAKSFSMTAYNCCMDMKAKCRKGETQVVPTSARLLPNFCQTRGTGDSTVAGSDRPGTPASSASAEHDRQTSARRARNCVQIGNLGS